MALDNIPQLQFAYSLKTKQIIINHFASLELPFLSELILYNSRFLTLTTIFISFYLIYQISWKTYSLFDYSDFLKIVVNITLSSFYLILQNSWKMLLQRSKIYLYTAFQLIKFILLLFRFLERCVNFTLNYFHFVWFFSF